MEFAPGGDMFEYVVKKNGLREEEARWFFQQLIVGLDYCHRMVSIHSSCLGAARHTWRGRGCRRAAQQPVVEQEMEGSSFPGSCWVLLALG
jgi:hypothetical protein